MDDELHIELANYNKAIKEYVVLLEAADIIHNEIKYYTKQINYEDSNWDYDNYNQDSHESELEDMLFSEVTGTNDNTEQELTDSQVTRKKKKKNENKIKNSKKNVISSDQTEQKSLEWACEAARADMRHKLQLDDVEMTTVSTEPISEIFAKESPAKHLTCGNLQTRCKQVLAATLHLYDYKQLLLIQENLGFHSWNTVLQMAVKYPTVSVPILTIWCDLHEDRPNCLNLQNLNVSDSVVINLCTSSYAITEINLSGCNHLHRETFNVIPVCLPFVTVIKCSGTKILSKTISRIAKRCKNLEYLDVRDTEVDLNSLTDILNKCRNFTSLLYNAREVTAQICNWFVFLGLQKRKPLQFWISDVAEEYGPFHISSSISRTSHFYLEVNFLDERQICCYFSTELTCLHITGGKFDFDCIKNLLHGDKLEELVIDCMSSEIPQIYELLKNHCKLHTLQLSGVQPKNVSMKSFFEEFVDCPLVNLKLEFLDEEGCKAMILKCKCLTSFRLKQASPQIQQILLSARFFAQLKELCFDFHLLTELQNKILMESYNLSKVSFRGSEISHEFLLDLICQNPLLEIFKIHQCKNCDDLVIFRLASTHPNLREAEFVDCTMVSEFGLYLLGRYCKFLRHIRLTLFAIKEKKNFGLYAIEAQCRYLVDDLGISESLLPSKKRLKNSLIIFNQNEN